ncbi:hypothetical protein F5B21DRAFT_169232 [Xylaria acuta]|nr:hypothetical protein F5B21DRAFT_169232 [Xylaria acuta]
MGTWLAGLASAVGNLGAMALRGKPLALAQGLLRVCSGHSGHYATGVRSLQGTGQGFRSRESSGPGFHRWLQPPSNLQWGAARLSSYRPCPPSRIGRAPCRVVTESHALAFPIFPNRLPDADRSRRVFRIPFPLSHPTLTYHIARYLDCPDEPTAALWHSPSLLTPTCVVNNTVGSFTLVCFPFSIRVFGSTCSLLSSSSFGFHLQHTCLANP